MKESKLLFGLNCFIAGILSIVIPVIYSLMKVPYYLSALMILTMIAVLYGMISAGSELK